jgi:prepilin-type N-terminal cleavage/methylation domain-containing protein
MGNRDRHLRCSRGERCRGFTLIELLAVMLILSILIWFLVTNLGGAREVVEAGLTRSRLGNIEAMLSAWADERGDFPSSSFTPEQGVAPNLSNLGSECLYLALCAAGQDGVGVLDEELANVDGDRLARRLEGFESLELYEIGDDWENPIAYLHHRDYGRRDLYQSLDPETGELLETQVTAEKNAATGRYHNPHTFQLLSAGPDGHFGTDDDIANYED